MSGLAISLEKKDSKSNDGEFSRVKGNSGEKARQTSAHVLMEVGKQSRLTASAQLGGSGQ